MYKSYVVPGVYAIVWGKNPRPEAVAMYVEEMKQASERQGQRLFGLGIAPEDSGIPDRAFSVIQAGVTPTVTRYIYAGAMVFKGMGAGPILKRTAFTAMTLLLRTECPIYVRSSVEDAIIGRPPANMQYDPIATLERLRKLGVT